MIASYVVETEHAKWIVGVIMTLFAAGVVVWCIAGIIDDWRAEREVRRQRAWRERVRLENERQRQRPPGEDMVKRCPICGCTRDEPVFYRYAISCLRTDCDMESGKLYTHHVG